MLRYWIGFTRHQSLPAQQVCPTVTRYTEAVEIGNYQQTCRPWGGKGPNTLVQPVGPGLEKGPNTLVQPAGPGRDRREAGAADGHRLPPGGALRPRLRLSLHSRSVHCKLLCSQVGAKLRGCIMHIVHFYLFFNSDIESNSLKNILKFTRQFSKTIGLVLIIIICHIFFIHFIHKEEDFFFYLFMRYKLDHVYKRKETIA